MSEQERETELVSGTIKGVTLKKPGQWQVEVQPQGSQYTKKLWTKDADLVHSLEGKLQQESVFVCEPSYWINQSGQEIRSLWIKSNTTAAFVAQQFIEAAQGQTTTTRSITGPAGGTGAATGSTPSTPLERQVMGESFTNTSGMSKEEWARKDSAGHKRACIAIAVSALSHTMPSDPTSEDLAKFGERVAILSSRWHASVLAERDDPTGESTPF